jgi:type IV secretion system protein VirB9
MKRWLALGLMAAIAGPLAAQVAPIPDFADPRLQTVDYRETAPIRLVAFPGAALTLVVMPGDRVRRAVISDGAAFRIAIVGDNDSLKIEPLAPGASAQLTLETSQRQYEFQLETGEGLAAAYVVRLVDRAEPEEELAADTAPLELTGTYKLSGKRALRPSEIGDDGERTYLQWGKYQSLPAVFGIGPTGGEEVVDGYMRDGTFVIDRVYPELVFRIDKDRAKAKRREELGG